MKNAERESVYHLQFAQTRALSMVTLIALLRSPQHGIQSNAPIPSPSPLQKGRGLKPICANLRNTFPRDICSIGRFEHGDVL